MPDRELKVQRSAGEQIIYRTYHTVCLCIAKIQCKQSVSGSTTMIWPR